MKSRKHWILGIRLPVSASAAFDALVKQFPYASRGEVARAVFYRGLKGLALTAKKNSRRKPIR